MAGFSFRYRPTDPPTVQKIKLGITTFNKGDTVAINASGQAILGTTASTAFIGVAQQTITGVVGVDTVDVLVDADAVYGVTDANARVKGATLDLAGATNAQGVAASTNKEFVVVADKTATQETLVRFNVGKHIDTKAL